MTALTDEQMAVVREIAGQKIGWLAGYACTDEIINDCAIAILAALADKRLSRRNEWLEDAAKVCEGMKITDEELNGLGILFISNKCAAAIRAMKAEGE